MKIKRSYEVRTKTKDREFTVDQFTGWFALYQAKKHAKKLVRYGDAKLAEVFRVTRLVKYE